MYVRVLGFHPGNRGIVRSERLSRPCIFDFGGKTGLSRAVIIAYGCYLTTVRRSPGLYAVVSAITLMEPPLFLRKARGCIFSIAGQASSFPNHLQLTSDIFINL